MKDSRAINHFLSRISFVTSIGDFVSLFAILVLMHNQTGKIEVAAYAIPMKALGIALGGAVFPSIVSRFTLRNLMIWTQLISGVITLAIVGLANEGVPPGWVYGLLVLQTILKQVFDGARDSYSKSIGSNDQHRSLQAGLLQAFYSAQVVGSILSFALIKTFGAYVPLFVDALSFFAAGALSLGLPDGVKENQSSLFRPFKYLGKRPALLQIFLLRSVGYWIPVGIFNYLLFSVFFESFGTEPLNSVWSYVAIGLGSGVSSRLLAKEKGILSHHKDTLIAAGALLLLAMTRFAFILVPSFGLSIAVLTIGGLCNGANAVTTQSLRRKLTTDEQFPEIVGLELVVGRFTDWAASTLILIAVTKFGLSFSSGILISAGFLVVLAGLHTSKELRNVG
ncbi:hypothetical protein WDW86_13485 [Bdellovibrionota bacterium FG-2]